MKKIKYLLILAVALFFTTPVDAANITNVSYDDSFKIDGTGSGTIEIVLFDLNNEPVFLTTATATNNSFSITLPKISGLENGKYKVKVADYDGSNSDTKEISIKVSQTKENNPNTYDGIAVSFVALGLSIIGITGCVIYFKKIKKCK